MDFVHGLKNNLINLVLGKALLLSVSTYEPALLYEFLVDVLLSANEKFSMRNNNLPILYQKVESVFGKKIFSVKECTELHHDILKKTEAFISVHTLRRLFGLVKSPHVPSFTTLNVLANYCGYSSIAELATAGDEGIGEEKGTSNLLLYLVSLFKNTPVQVEDDLTYINMVRHTVYFLEREPQLAEPFQREIAKTKNGQDYYFERFVNMDKLNGYYGNGLSHYLREKTTPEAQIFGNASLALRYWLTGNNHLFNQYAGKVNLCSLTDDVHPFVCGRYFGTRLLKAAFDEADTTVLLSEAKAFYRQQKSVNPGHRFPGFELTMAMMLALIGEWEDTLFYTKAGLEKYCHFASLKGKQIHQSLLLFRAVAFTQSGNTAEATKVYEEIDVTEFYFLAKKFLSILYIQTGKDLKKIKTAEPQLDHLLGETGFVRLRQRQRSENTAAMQVEQK